MYNYRSILGNEGMLSNLSKLVASRETSHAYMFISKDEVSARQIASTFAKSILCSDFGQDVCEACASCIAFDKGNHPDVIWIDLMEDKKSISVKEIREALLDIDMKPYSSPYKIYLIGHVDQMTEEAQNTILKSLEEPNQYVKLILLVSDLENVLTTIQSRCLKINIGPIEESHLKAYLASHGVSDQDLIDFYIYYAAGSRTKIDQLINDPDFVKTRDEVLDMTDKLVESDILKILEVNRFFESHKENIQVVLDILETWFRDLLMTKRGFQKLINQDRKKEVVRQAGVVSEEKIFLILENLAQFKNHLEYNINMKLATLLLQANS